MVSSYDFYMIKRRLFSWALLSVTVAGAFLFTGCSTPESRISEHRDLYDSLPTRQQQRVAQGQIAPGMSENEVWLTRGSPGQRVNGYALSRSTERRDHFGY